MKLFVYVMWLFCSISLLKCICIGFCGCGVVFMIIVVDVVVGMDVCCVVVVDVVCVVVGGVMFGDSGMGLFLFVLCVSDCVGFVFFVIMFFRFSCFCVLSSMWL